MLFNFDSTARGVSASHTFAECLAEREEKPRLSFCESRSCLAKPRARIYRVRGLGRAARQDVGRSVGDCPKCGGILYHSSDYYLLVDKSRSHVIAAIDAGMRLLPKPVGVRRRRRAHA